MNYVVRPVVKSADEFSRLVNLLIGFAREHEMGRLSAKGFDLSKAIPWVANCVECAAWVAESDTGELVGTIGLYQTSPWYSNEAYYTDGWLYVTPEYRNSKVASTLLAEAKAFAEANDKPLVVGIFSTEDTEHKLQMLQRRGFKLIGGTLLSGG